MKLLNSVGPNPKVVRMYMTERGIDVGLEEIDLMAGGEPTGRLLETQSRRTTSRFSSRQW